MQLLFRVPGKRAFLAQVDNDDLIEWAAFFRIHPMPDEWHVGGTIAAATQNTMGGKKSGQAFKPEDYYPLPPRQQTAEEMEAFLMASFAGLGQ